RAEGECGAGWVRRLRAGSWLHPADGKKPTTAAAAKRAGIAPASACPTSRFYTAITKLELAPWRRLLLPDAARDELGPGVVLALRPRAAEAPEHGERSDGGERIGNRTLEDRFGRRRQRRVRRQIVVEPLQGCEKARHLGVPVERRRIVPRFGAACLRQRPVVEIADMRENFRRRPVRSVGTVGREARRRAADRLAATIRDRRHGVRKNRADCIHAVTLQIAADGRLPANSQGAGNVAAFFSPTKARSRRRDELSTFAFTFNVDARSGYSR